jgi:hypothetical protein
MGVPPAKLHEKPSLVGQARPAAYVGFRRVINPPQDVILPHNFCRIQRVQPGYPPAGAVICTSVVKFCQSPNS